MKNLSLIIGLTILSTSFTSLSKAKKTAVYQQDTEIKGYVIVQGVFKEMKLTFRQTRNGYTLQKWEMVEPIYHSNSWGYGGEKQLISLNSQNQLAIKYNFTHYVETTYGNAYLTINQ